MAMNEHIAFFGGGGAFIFTHRIKILSVTTLLGNLKEPVELGDPITCANVKLCLFLFMPALEIVFRETKVLKTVSSG